MNNIQKMAKSNLILRYYTGSKLYGTQTPESDTDIAGIFIAPREYYLGFNSVKEVDFSVVDKLENGKNSANAVDEKYYELRQFMKLAMQNNPNIIEQLFVPKNLILTKTVVGEKLKNMAYLFPHAGAYDRFIGYAISQRKKLLNQTPEHISNKSSHRKDLIEKYGYDTKFAHHLIRLLWEGCELFHKHRIVFPLAIADELIAIKTGQKSLKQVLYMADKLEEELVNSKSRQLLPEKPRTKQIEEVLITLLNMQWNGENKCMDG